jgi:hypothetical protein
MLHNRFMLSNKIIALHSENRTKHVNTHGEKITELFVNIKAGGTYSSHCD